MAKTLQAFRTFLLNVGLGPKRAQEHVGTIEAFAQAVLLKQDPP